MSLHNRIDLIDALFQVALIDLGAGPADSPPESGGKCSITLVFWAIGSRVKSYAVDMDDGRTCLFCLARVHLDISIRSQDLTAKTVT